jgi:dolichyl-phosphate beta-glucosyltransferase
LVRVRIIVPCYNEATRFDPGAFDAFLASTQASTQQGALADVGFLLVNDGSTDATLTMLEGLSARWPQRVQVLDSQPNQGKAEAVRAGMLVAFAESSVSYVGYFDADLATPLDALSEFIATLDDAPQIDLVIGARVALLGRKITRRPVRHYVGRVFATAASAVLGLAVYDTQCGAKLLRVTPITRGLFDKPFGSRWIFDVEMLARYLTRGGHASGLYELPLRAWTDVGESKVKARDFLRAGGEMAAIYRAYRLPRTFSAFLSVLAAPFVRYVGAGGVGTLLHYLTLALLVEIFRQEPEHATVVGALVGALVNYVLNYHFTFASRASHRSTLPKFLVVAAVSAALSGLGMRFATEQLGLHYLPAQLFCTLLVLVLGFVLNRVWTFRAPRKLPPTPRG